MMQIKTWQKPRVSADTTTNSLCKINNFFPAIKVWTFWETHKILKNLPRDFDKSADLLSKCQNHKEDFSKLCVLLKKSEL